MKKISFLFLVLLTIPFIGICQNSQGKTDDMGRVALMAFVPDQADGIPTSARQLLQNKMQQIAVQNGIGGSGANPRFCIVPSVNVISKEITPTAPPMQAVNLEVTFYIVDAATQSMFSQASISVKGVGQTEDKAYIAGLKNINPKAGQFKGFIETGKTKIIEYYNSQCDVIMKGAQALAGQKKYEEALAALLSVPDVSRECFDKCMTLSIDIYKEYANYKCTEYMSGAKAAWAAMNTEKAAEFLGKITPDMECYPQAVQLNDEIKQKMLADGANAWTFKMKQYDASVEKDKLMIQSAKDVAVAWGNWGASANFDWNWLYPNSTKKSKPVVEQSKTTTQPQTASSGNVFSYFDNNDEDWKVVGDSKNAFAKPDYHPSGGNPSGFISAKDEATGGIWYWKAPDKYLGSKGDAFGKKLSFDLKQSNTTSQFEADDVILEGNGITLVCKLPVHPGIDWTSYTLVLSPEGGWKINNSAGPLASAEDIGRVLSNLTNLKIRGEFVEGPDEGGIDNVCLYLK
jgi:tetratricopeptide (TPR) repeat protein